MSSCPNIERGGFFQQSVVETNPAIYLRNALSPLILFQGAFQKSDILGYHALPINSGAKMEELQGCRHIWEQMVIPTAVSKEASGHVYLM